jgi:Flp pilus assembly protein TadB
MNKIVDFLNSAAGTALVVILGLAGVLYFSVVLLQTSREKKMQSLEQAQEEYILECVNSLTEKHNLEYNVALKECKDTLGTK